MATRVADYFEDDFGEGFDLIYVSNIIHSLGPDDIAKKNKIYRNAFANRKPEDQVGYRPTQHLAALCPAVVRSLEEAGELIAARAAGITSPGRWAEIGEVLAGTVPGRQDQQQITLFKSVGHAVYDLQAARAVYEAAKARGAGLEWEP